MIYVGTGRGVDKLDPATGHIKHFTTADGLATSFVNVAFRHRDGSLWFGTLQGLSRLIPQAERPTSPPPIVISGLRIAGDSYRLSELGATEIGGLELGPNKNNIEINFSGRSLAVGESLRYQYKLEGTSSDWIAPSEQRSVNYPNLPSGAYRFLVRAVSADGTLSETPAVISFRVLPQVWRRWWFIASAALLIFLALISIERSRAARLRALSESENRYRALAETASDGIFTIDDLGKIIFVNPAAETMFGSRASDLLGRDIAALIPGYLSSLQMAGLDNDKARLEISWEARELFGMHTSGAKIPLELSFGAFARDHRRFVTLIARDVTERKRAEEALRKSREERLTELERVRRRIATDLHDDIGSSLTQISLLSEVVNRKLGAEENTVSAPLSEIAGMSRELVDAMSDIVWAINPQKDHLSDLLQRMRHFATQIFIMRQIEFSFRAPDPAQDIPMGANLRRELFLIFKEAINNLIRHSGCSEAEIEFRAGEDSIFLQLSDNGRGFDLAQKNEGHGLTSMRDRTKGLGGAFAISTQPGQGARLSFTIPLTQKDQQPPRKVQ